MKKLVFAFVLPFLVLSGGAVAVSVLNSSIPVQKPNGC